MQKPAKIFRLMHKGRDFPFGMSCQEAEQQFGSGVVFWVGQTDSGRFEAGRDEMAYPLYTIFRRCNENGLVPMFYIDESQGDKQQSACVQECISLAGRYKLKKIVILSPVSDFLAEVRQLDPGSVEVKTGRLAGYSKSWRQEMENEAELGTNLIVFYRHEHGPRVIKKMIRRARSLKISIFFNIRKENDHGRDIMKGLTMILAMAAKNGGGVFCNDPPAVRAVLEKAMARR